LRTSRDGISEIKQTPAYTTKLGKAYIADSRGLMETLPDESVDLVMTSPPFALLRQKDYGNVADHEYIAWFMPFAKEIQRILKPTGSFVLDIAGRGTRANRLGRSTTTTWLSNSSATGSTSRRTSSGTTPPSFLARRSGSRCAGFGEGRRKHRLVVFEDSES